MARDMQVIWVESEEGIFLRKGLDDPNQIELLQQIRLAGNAKQGISSKRM
jgi:hypothetical protein